jgi:ankyrin repeat protein
MKKLLPFVVLFWIFFPSLFAQEPAATVDPGAILIELAFNGNLEGVQKLVEAGVPVESVNPDKSTSLMWAAYNGHSDVTAYLLALMMASAEGHVEVVRLLLAHGARADILDRDGDTAEKFARERGQTEVLELLGKPPAGSDPR